MAMVSNDGGLDQIFSESVRDLASKPSSFFHKTFDHVFRQHMVCHSFCPFLGHSLSFFGSLETEFAFCFTLFCFIYFYPDFIPNISILETYIRIRRAWYISSKLSISEWLRRTAIPWYCASQYLCICIHKVIYLYWLCLYLGIHLCVYVWSCVCMWTKTYILDSIGEMVIK